VTALELRGLYEGAAVDGVLERAGCLVGSPQWAYWRGLLGAIEVTKNEWSQEKRK
jgi:hypothetical protein